ncbi:MAG: PmoA family protein [Planctomycetaceae bacterium]|nr:PmoA family protein [Planctomycetaceae bacterium]
MLHRLLACTVTVCALNSLVWSADGPAVTATTAPGLVGIRIGDQPFAVFNHSPGLAKPYIEPLRAPGNHVVTALAPFDHKHHKGIWVGVEHVNGVNFWGGKYQQQDAVAVAPALERIETEKVEVKPADNGAVALHIQNAWQGEDGKSIVTENTVITTYPNRLMVYDITLTAANGPVKFEDTKEGFLAIRVAATMTAKPKGVVNADAKTVGVIVNADGDTGDEACWGKTSPWVDYSGPVDGKPVGVALFDHPGNFRKSRYHVRAYGLFAISPFGEKTYSKGASEAPQITLEKGDKVHVKYGLFVHAGDAKAGKVAEAYSQFVEWTK